MPARLLIDLYAIALGLVVGSYLNVVVHRLPRGASTLAPRSRCPRCGAAIRARDNIPILGYLLLSGRCRSCAGRISLRYPLVEAVTALLFLASVERFGLSGPAIAACIFCSLMVVLAAIDAEHFILPDRIVFPGIAAGLALQRWLPQASLTEAVVGTFVGAGILALTINAWLWLRDEEGMGLGDVNMLAMVGAFLGWKGVLATLFIASLTGAAWGVSLIALGRLRMKSRLPFGLFLALGAVVALFWGRGMIEAYLQWL